MAIPLIPARDVAKLVLGYLAEEQLMTAYDEFLQSSPYLDAMHNEYDRIFMTSLKHIMAEYRALRIQVENCQPFALRTHLLQLPNLLEMLRFLIKHVDISIFQSQNTPSQNHHHPGTERITESKRRESLGVISTCKDQNGRQFSNLIETTSLADLPGSNSKTKKSMLRVLDKMSAPVVQFSGVPVLVEEPQPEPSRSHLEGSVQSACSLSFKPLTAHESRLSSGNCSPPDAEGSKLFNHVRNTEEPASGTFQEFASGVTSGSEINFITHNSTDNVGANITFHNPLLLNQTFMGKKTQYLIQAHDPNMIERRKEEKKLNIISDVKLDCDPTSRLLKTSVQHSSATPSVKKLVINGNQQNPAFVKGPYTKAEIMAMPTVILVPAKGPPPPHVAQQIQIQPLADLPRPSPGPRPGARPRARPRPRPINTSGSSAGTGASLEALTIDIAYDSPAKPTSVNEAPLLTTTDPVNSVPKNCAVSTLLNPLDPKNSSVPKDSVVSIVGKTSTPQVLPPTRKSSSTPRRTSHVRVLDFATPRRILQGTIQEHPQNEILLSGSPNIEYNECKSNEKEAAKKNTPLQQTCKKQNWDAELRALVGGTGPVENTPKPKPRSTKKKKKPPEKSTETPKTAKKISKKNLSRKSKANSQERTREAIVEPEPLPEVAVKPTINIITEWNTSLPKEDKSTDKSSDMSKSKSGELQGDTPESDHLSLQNAIGAKINISDIFETPYKQALYDIQMETPQFLKPDIPGSQPASEIKITDIPTPRFLNTPGEALQTDYSSGGSYYKPDDHDYAPIPELDFILTETEKRENASKSKDQPKDSKSTRPVRKCTKNISYCDAKAKTIENKDDLDSSSDTTILDVTGEFPDIHGDETRKSISSALNQNKKTKPKESKKKLSTIKSRRQSKKETLNQFMKIKPRRPTPVKLNRSKSTKERVNSPNKKRTSSKNSTAATTPAAAPAPTKSRRKSSTPRKLHTKVFSSDSLDTNSSEGTNREKEINKLSPPFVQDSNSEILLRRINAKPAQSTQDTAPTLKEASPASCMNDAEEDINKIKAYIESTVNSARQTPVTIEDECSSLQDFVKRGFDIETAKIIERDLLDTCIVSESSTTIVSFPVQAITVTASSSRDKHITSLISRVDSLCEANSDISDDDDEEEVEFGDYECTEESANYYMCEHHAQNNPSTSEQIRIDEKYSLDIQIGDDEIHLRPTQFKILLDEDPESNIKSSSFVETEAAVCSISNMVRLYTPLKDQRTSIQEQCIDIFDSTLTSLDTPLKANSPKQKDVSVTELVEITIEKDDVKDKAPKKRKRVQNSPDSTTENKKTKKNRYLPNIQNFDIDTVLSKLHGS